ncbi:MULTISPECIES: DUF4395 domain-containing protein [unclassified Micromonospora]|uniref:DUF4395 domain-containing protein n=1 Tax=unclassified Micromonospora TaxID=2617518 RepID=UPI0022C6E8FC|nr:DUF4395 domain-containing protein [Micromonospora sp. AKA38]GHJ16829.1 membrane protein [Micromonospora sp. AKA38]
MLLDPRGARFAAALTTVVLAVALLTGSGPLLLAQAAVFALTAASPRLAPYGLLFRAVVAPRLDPPTELEPVAPVRFAQLVGLAFTVVGAVGWFAGLPALGLVATAGALAAAFLNAAFGLCLGCEAYLAVRRLTGRPLAARVALPPR